MVLYYKKVKREVDIDPDISKIRDFPPVTNAAESQIGAPTHKSPTKYDQTTLTHKSPTKYDQTTLTSVDDRPFYIHDRFDETYKTPFSDRKELYYSLLEDNFNNLSIDNKLVVMYKTSIQRSNTTDNYIIICLLVLIIIAIKLYSK